MIFYLKALTLSLLFINYLVAAPISYGEHRDIGRRPTMEDMSLAIAPLNTEAIDSGLFGIFDGHGSVFVALYVAKAFEKQLKSCEGTAEERLKQCILNINESLKKTRTARQVGTCAVVALIENNNLTVANVGDSRAVLCRAGQAIALSQDHTITREREAFLARGGTIIGETEDDFELSGPTIFLTVGRAIGDHEISALSAEPDIVTTSIEPEDEFLILACDGIFEDDYVLDRQQAVNVVKQSLQENADNPDRAKIAAQKLVDVAYEKGTNDNLSAIVVLLNQNG